MVDPDVDSLILVRFFLQIVLGSPRVRSVIRNEVHLISNDLGYDGVSFAFFAPRCFSGPICRFSHSVLNVDSVTRAETRDRSTRCRSITCPRFGGVQVRG